MNKGTIIQGNITGALRGKVLSFGELLLRIAPDYEGQWLKDNNLLVYMGGAELNVATALALWGIPSSYITALPKNGISAQIVACLQDKLIDVSQICYRGHRIGLYFLTKGQDLKHDALIYDRAHSAFADLQPGMINWGVIFDGVNWFHSSAICPAIGQNIADVCLEALQAACSKGITVSIDLNYRSKLWQYGKLPAEVMPELVKYCDIIMGNIWAAELMLKVPVRPDINEVGNKNMHVEVAQRMSESIQTQFSKCKVVANTFRFNCKEEIDYYATLYTGNKFYVSNEYSTTHMVDKVGSGDCFMAGLIYGFYNNLHPQQTLEFATAAAYTKFYVHSDATDKTVQDIQQAIKI